MDSRTVNTTKRHTGISGWTHERECPHAGNPKLLPREKKEKEKEEEKRKAKRAKDKDKREKIEEKRRKKKKEKRKEKVGSRK